MNCDVPKDLCRIVALTKNGDLSKVMLLLRVLKINQDSHKGFVRILACVMICHLLKGLMKLLALKMNYYLPKIIRRLSVLKMNQYLSKDLIKTTVFSYKFLLMSFNFYCPDHETLISCYLQSLRKLKISVKKNLYLCTTF